MTITIVPTPAITPEESEAIAANETTPGGICNRVRPGTLGYQQCWRITGHADAAHISQDGAAWTDDTPMTPEGTR